MEEHNLPPNPATPSRLRPPTQRKSIFSKPAIAEAEENAAGLVSAEPKNATSLVRATRPRLASPRGKQKGSNITSLLPPPLPQPTVSADGMVKTYKTMATATARPAPVTKPIQRNNRATVARTNILGTTLRKGEEYAMVGQDRPGWDIKGRLEDMQKMMEGMKQRMEMSNQTNESYQSKVSEMHTTLEDAKENKQRLEMKLTARERENEELTEQLYKLRRQLENDRMEREQEWNRLKTNLLNEMDDLKRQKDSLMGDLELCKRNLAYSSEENEQLKSTLSRQSTSLLEVEGQICALKSKLEVSEEKSMEKSKEIQALQESLKQTEESLRMASQKIQEGETLRRRLHNTVQELKGNIRVFCRVRPLLASELAASPLEEKDQMNHIWIGIGEEQQEEIRMIQSMESASGAPITKPYPFTFDKVFSPLARQSHVFEEISQLVQSALDGYKVCIFAYGQTGSGKTFTMEGGNSSEEQSGMIPRAVQQIFTSTEALKEKGWSFTFEASYLEIYNETIRDLLAARPEQAEGKLEIKHVDGRTFVTDLTVVPVDTPTLVLALLQKAAQNRAVAETQCNERSSRSHSVFTLKINGDNGITMEKIEGLLHLIDLAGSERLGQSGSTGDRLKETQAINKSLSALGDVIHSIANKEGHIPYRNSKLTYLLQNSLGGNCKTLMFVNISPALSNFQESLCSLRFATKVNSCQIGTATRKIAK